MAAGAWYSTLTATESALFYLYETEALTAGTTVRLSRHSLSIPVGDEFLGRVIDPLGTPLDGLPPPAHAGRENLEKGSPAIIARDFVHKPLYTGIKIIDTLIPIGKGQRQLIVGDEGLGRTFNRHRHRH